MQLKGLDMDSKSGVVSVKDDVDLYQKSLPDDLPMSVVKKVKEHDTIFIASSTLAFGELSVQAMADNDKLERTTGAIPMVGRDALNMTLDREKEYNNTLGKGEKVMKYGASSINYRVQAGRNAGQLKAVRESLNEIALDALK